MVVKPSKPQWRQYTRPVKAGKASVHDDGEGESVDLADEDEKRAPKRQKAAAAVAVAAVAVAAVAVQNVV